jgi:LysR family transcriptional regulator, regulator for genes of the gallate degradation pathway
MMIWHLNLRHLRAAAVIARLGSISAAAEAIGISQPAITQALAKLEMQLDLTLFERRPDGMCASAATAMLTPRIEAALCHINSPRVTMAQLRAMIAIADAGSYAGASTTTGLAQPSLHRAIGDLSVVLKRTLVERRGKGIVLTDVGRKIVRGFRLARAELEAGLSELASLKGRETGRIAIGAMPLARARLLPAAVTAFHHDHPEVFVTIIEGSFHELVESLRDGAVDLMIGALRELLPGDDIVQRALFEDRPVVIGRKGHPLRQPGLAALAKYPWIMPAPDTPLRMQWERLFSDAGLPVPQVPIACGSVMMIRQILIDSDFLTLLSPDQVAVELEAGWLDIISDVPSGLTRTIGVSTRTGWRPTHLQAAFLGVLSRKACPGEFTKTYTSGSLSIGTTAR